MWIFDAWRRDEIDAALRLLPTPAADPMEQKEIYGLCGGNIRSCIESWSKYGYNDTLAILKLSMCDDLGSEQVDLAIQRSRRSDKVPDRLRSMFSHNAQDAIRHMQFIQIIDSEVVLKMMNMYISMESFLEAYKFSILSMNHTQMRKNMFAKFDTICLYFVVPTSDSGFDITSEVKHLKQLQQMGQKGNVVGFQTDCLQIDMTDVNSVDASARKVFTFLNRFGM